jgi:hypothetical protein
LARAENLRPDLSARRGKVFFDICILGRNTTLENQRWRIAFISKRYQNNQATKGV